MTVDPTLLVFFIAAITLLIIPGPAVFYIIARSTHQGTFAGVVSAFGIVTGGVVHVIASALGLSALVVASPAAFAVVKLCGAAYLFYLGVRVLRSSAYSRVTPPSQLDSLSLRRIYWDGLFVNLFNPKTILFFVAFLPQFIDQQKDDMGAQILFLGALLVGMGLITDSIYAYIAGNISHWLRSRASRGVLLERFSGGVYISLSFFAVFGSTG